MKVTYFSAFLVSSACAYGNKARRESSNGIPPWSYIQGDDPPADPATKGYFVNHFGMLASNLTATRQWYSKVLGVRHIFTMDVSSEFSVLYMGHSQGGRNGAGYQTGLEMARDKNNMDGLIKFVSYKKAVNRTYMPDAQTTFSHIGLVVDDIAAAKACFQDLGVNIVKRRGVLDFSPATADRRFAAAFGFADIDNDETQKDIAAALPGFKALGFFGDFVMIADPDGNLVEVQPQVSSGAL
ncbi:hypothetical protein EK21DRAFT_89446 [Setomelanomma holmii]|uniref:Glyoxalase/fosfomycin resistance/dioxygenase domain-containing protein n=1 Tax=Setomelanomma holmii TaxID=210430 RepID=A0A9P4H7U1_9PLEO|nr:hypothetical protein EK21DRAFT_89446 [Setomelanomma holmii]